MIQQRMKEKLKNLGESSGENETVSKMAKHDAWLGILRSSSFEKNVLLLARSRQES